MLNSSMDLYERFHSADKLQRKVVDNRNFTYRLIIETLRGELSKVKRVLDVGCGVGTIDFYFAKMGAHVIGTDVSRNAINIARKNAVGLRLSDRTRFLFSKFPSGAFTGKFDLIICTEVLEHLKDDLRAVSRVYDLLKSGGIALFSSPLNSSVLYKFGLAKGFDRNVGHLRRYTEREFADLIEGSGLKVVKIIKAQGLLRDSLFIFPVGGFIVRIANRFGFVSDFLTFIDNLLLPLGASDIIVLAEK